MTKRSRGRPEKRPLDDISLRRAILLTSVAHLLETGKTGKEAHACRLLASEEKGGDWDQYCQESNIRRSLAVFLRDELKNAKRCWRANDLATFALFRVRLRSPSATRADAAAWLLNAHEYYLTKMV